MSDARASTTDPECRKMKFPDGGYRLAYNVQFATDVASGVIVGVDVTNQGSDQGLLGPMLQQIRKRCGRAPQALLVDGGFATLEDIHDAHEQHQCLVSAPPKNEQQKLAAGQDPYRPEKRDTPQTAAWRARMGTPEGQAISRLRGRTAEWVNAQSRNRNLGRLPVRGLKRCRAVALWSALAHNLWHVLRHALVRAPAT